jgi:hypothetical protein
MGTLLGTTMVWGGISVSLFFCVMGGAGPTSRVVSLLASRHHFTGCGYGACMQQPDEPAGHPGEDDEDGDPVYELIRPEDFLAASPFPADAQRMGIDRWSDDAGLIAIASSLDSRKLSHRIVAWVMLVLLTGWLVAQLWFELTAA